MEQTVTDVPGFGTGPRRTTFARAVTSMRAYEASLWEGPSRASGTRLVEYT